MRTLVGHSHGHKSGMTYTRSLCVRRVFWKAAIGVTQRGPYTNVAGTLEIGVKD